jgi:hypothetical protein
MDSADRSDRDKLCVAVAEMAGKQEQKWVASLEVAVAVAVAVGRSGRPTTWHEIQARAVEE